MVRTDATADGSRRAITTAAAQASTPATGCSPDTVNPETRNSTRAAAYPQPAQRRPGDVRATARPKRTAPVTNISAPTPKVTSRGVP